MSGSFTQSPAVVLLVEDESFVRMTAADMLDDAGFTVIEAANADVAWSVLEHRDDVGVLFTDIDMPGSMDGFVLAARVAERWPHIRLVVTSGRCRPRQGDVPDYGWFVSKPYLMSQVLDAFEQASSSRQRKAVEHPMAAYAPWVER